MTGCVLCGRTPCVCPPTCCGQEAAFAGSPDPTAAHLVELYACYRCGRLIEVQAKPHPDDQPALF